MKIAHYIWTTVFNLVKENHYTVFYSIFKVNKMNTVNAYKEI